MRDLKTQFTKKITLDYLVRLLDNMTGQWVIRENHKVNG